MHTLNFKKKITHEVNFKELLHEFNFKNKNKKPKQLTMWLVHSQQVFSFEKGSKNR